MPSDNIYQSPESNLQAETAEFGPLSFFSARGRIGRVRLLGWGSLLGVVFMVAIAMAGGLTAVTGDAGAAIGGILMVILYIVLFYFYFVFTIQRCHDINISGWWSIAFIIIPLIFIVLYFIPGTKGPNRFGNEPPPNSTGVIVAACLVPVIFVIGILAAIAIPAYHDYVQRAQEAQMQQE